MKQQTKTLLVKGLKVTPIGVILGTGSGLLFGFFIGCIVCGLSTLVICDYMLSNALIDMEAKQNASC